MKLPIQSEPVQRTMASQPFAVASAGARPCGEGVVPSQSGVEASSWADLLASVGKGPIALTTLPTFMPFLPV